VVAGAGTGKTRTIVGKVAYLLKKGIVMPEEVLMMSFGRGARDEMADRIHHLLNSEIDVSTFHSLGYNIIGHSLDRKPSISEEAEDRRALSSRLNQQIEGFFKRRVENYDFINSVSRYFTYYFEPVENELDFQTEQEYEEYLASNEIRTLNGEKVKSYEECMIANFLFLNGIEYEYEKEYPVDTATKETRQYRPDFFLSKYGLWIEHFGIDRENRTAPGVDKRSYLDDMAWKRNLHKENYTHLVETFSYERIEGILISGIKEKLDALGVKYNPIPRDEIFNKLKRLGDVTLFVGLIVKFLNLFKSSQSTIKELRGKAKGYVNWRRYHAFLDIFELIYDDYEAALQESGRIDFNDMIIQATSHIQNGDYKSKFNYILVDEFQDISKSRFRFLKALLNQDEDCSLFCVGDDWQSIYRFTGSDLSIMTDFEEHFLFTETMFLDQTFRNNSSVSDFSSRFIMRNPAQYKKNIRAEPVDYPAISVEWHDNLNQSIKDAIDEIQSAEKTPSKVFILGRYRQEHYNDFDRSILSGISSSSQRKLDEISSPPLELQYQTLHGSKGKEADYVIIIGIRSGTFGFPCEIEDDPVLKLVLSREDAFPNAEERRLFYVGLTRAKKRVFLLADRHAVSSFIQEALKDKVNVEEIGAAPHYIECPTCRKGLIHNVPDRNGSRFTCSNAVCRYSPTTCPQCKSGFLYQNPENDSTYVCSRCSFSARICPQCREGYLVVREKNGRFWGCSNFGNSDCRFTEPIPL
jgi:DNA helicase-4